MATQGTTTDLITLLLASQKDNESLALPGKVLGQFDKVLNNRLAKIKSVLQSKTKEYARGSDCYHNFNVAARILGSSREKALLGMMVKHYASILDIIDQPEMFSNEIIDEKIGDMINYLILLEGMLLE